jgi:hypothetical protein
LDQIDNMDAVALGEDVGSHFGVPTAGLVAKVDPSFKHLGQTNDGHIEFLLFGFILHLRGFQAPQGKALKHPNAQMCDFRQLC